MIDSLSQEMGGAGACAGMLCTKSCLCAAIRRAGLRRGEEPGSGSCDWAKSLIAAYSVQEELGIDNLCPSEDDSRR